MSKKAFITSLLVPDNVGMGKGYKKLLTEDRYAVIGTWVFFTIWLVFYAKAAQIFRSVKSAEHVV